MSVFINDNIISLTRGDSLRSIVTIKNSDGTPYIPSSGDVITFGMKKHFEDTECLIKKNIPITTMELYIEPGDTKDLDFGDYYYDIQIQFSNGDVYTFITFTKFRILREVV